MNFSSLKDDYFRVQRGEGYSIRLENKQRINLSDHAYSILINDKNAFSNDDTSMDLEHKITSDIINQVFLNFKMRAKSSIAYRLAEKRAELNQLFNDLPLKNTDKNIVVDALLQKYKEELTAETAIFLKEKGKLLNIRLHDASIEYLVLHEGKDEAEYYNDNIGSYLKAVIEEYANLPYLEREKIICKHNYETMLLGISDGNMLKLTMKKPLIIDGVKKTNIIYVKPYDVLPDTGRLYNYLVGNCSQNKEGPWRPQSIRLTSILKCEHTEKHSPLRNTAEIKEQLRTKGVQYLSSEVSTEKIIVQFTPKGEQMYKTMLHQRPLYTSRQEDEGIYEFNCTRRQAEVYFFKFGQDVKIIFPDDFAQFFYWKYESAAKQYEADSGINLANT